ncbi:hypothetical protein [Fundidesulfovibrio terrae]|uniref:hypothetical protein n=1 Tax=Fundidesulfovibrio terrae TaxID=2922866 RepID=UPI001FB00913|nr:hypothetical protein [Fundidesulfovibrio terrae]
MFIEKDRLAKFVHNNFLFVYNAALLVVAIVIYLFLLNIPETGGMVKRQFWVSLFVSVFVAAMLGLIPKIYEYCAKYLEAGRITSFFGTSIRINPVRYVFPYRVLLREYREQKTHVWETYFTPDVEPSKIPVPEGVRAWIPFQDIRAAVYVSRLLGRYVDITPKYIVDSDISEYNLDEIDYTMVAIGLGFNWATNLIERFTRQKLFKIVWDESCKFGVRCTDHFIVPGFDVDISDKDRDYSIIARVACPQQECKNSRYFFVCAGRTADGTAAAGYFLQKKWKEILKMYGSGAGDKKDLEKDSMVVVVEHQCSSEQGKEMEMNVQFARKEGEPVVRFFRNEES